MTLTDEGCPHTRTEIRYDTKGKTRRDSWRCELPAGHPFDHRNHNGNRQWSTANSVQDYRDYPSLDTDPKHDGEDIGREGSLW